MKQIISETDEQLYADAVERFGKGTFVIMTSHGSIRNKKDINRLKKLREIKKQKKHGKEL